MTLAAFVLFPLLGWAFFRSMPLVLAVPATLVGGYLLLPASIGYDAPLLPSINKESMSALTTIAFAIAYTRPAYPALTRRSGAPAVEADVRPGWIPQALWARVLLALALFGPGMTALTNMHPVNSGPMMLPAMTPYDALNLIQTSLIALLPLVVGRKYLASANGHTAILLVLATAGLLYSLPTLAEVRLSPQFHNIVYGFFPHDFSQHIRGDGFRPVVFLQHGLVLSLFLCVATLSILAYMRAIDGDRRVMYFFAAAYMTVVLVLSKSLGMVLVAAMTIPVVLFFSIRWQFVFAAAIAGAVFAYPVLRSSGFSPLSPVVSAVYSFNPSRAGSLDYRLQSEDTLVAHANRKPVFGWGGWGRSEVFNAQGRLVSVRDGAWIIKLGQYGWAGLISLLGLLVAPIVLLAAQSRTVQMTAATSGLCVVLAANLIDIVPNSGLTPLTWMMAGALLGHLEIVRARAGQTATAPAGSAAPVAAASPALARSGAGGPVHARDAAPRVEARTTEAAAPAPSDSTGAAPKHDLDKMPLAARLRARAVQNRAQHGSNGADPSPPRGASPQEGAATQPRYSRFAQTSPGRSGA